MTNAITTIATLTALTAILTIVFILYDNYFTARYNAKLRAIKRGKKLSVNANPNNRIFIN